MCRFLSLSIRTTFRFLTVTCSLPMCPAARMPLNTRDGNADEPIEPGARWNIEPWLFAPPPKLWRRMTPWKPLPFDVPITSTLATPSKMSTRTWSPGLNAAPGARRNSRRSRVGGTPAFSWCPRTGFVARLTAVASTRPSWIASYPSFSAERQETTTHGPAWMTVTGATEPSSRKSCVIPTLRPIIPSIMFASLPRTEGLDLDVDTRGQVELHQGVHDLGRRLQDVEQPL